METFVSNPICLFALSTLTSLRIFLDARDDTPANVSKRFLLHPRTLLVYQWTRITSHFLRDKTVKKEKFPELSGIKSSDEHDALFCA